MKTSPSRNALLGVLGSTAALSALIAVALARGDGNSASAPAAAPVRPNASSPGMMVARDAETGQLRAPTPEEMAALQPTPRGKTEAKRPTEMVRLANGAIGITLDESTYLYSVAAKGADGTIQRACVPNDRLNAALAAEQTSNPIKKEAADEK